jgi:hypothetical protein
MSFAVLHLKNFWSISRCSVLTQCSRVLLAYASNIACCLTVFCTCFATPLVHFHYVSVCPHALLRHHSTAAHPSIEYQYQIPPVTYLAVSYLGEGSTEFNNLHKHLTFCRKCIEMDLSSISGLVFTYSFG